MGDRGKARDFHPLLDFKVGKRMRVERLCGRGDEMRDVYLWKEKELCDWYGEARELQVEFARECAREWEGRVGLFDLL